MLWSFSSLRHSLNGIALRSGSRVLYVFVAMEFRDRFDAERLRSALLRTVTESHQSRFFADLHHNYRLEKEVA